MRKLNKSIAVLTTATMVLSPMSVFAATATTSAAKGNSVIENDSSSDVAYSRIVLPTATDGLYNFTIDPNGLLEQYNGYAAGTLYFANAATYTVANPEDSSSDSKLYIKTKTKDDDGIDSLKDALTATDDAVTAVDDGFYLWIPDTSDGAEAYAGKYEAITLSNLATYFDVTASGSSVSSLALKTLHAAGEVVCDGNIYTDSYREFDPDKDDLADYGDLSKDFSTFTYSSGLYWADKDSSSTFTAITADDAATYIEYTAVPSTYSNTSDALTITNKSTYDTTVTATVTVENTGDLVYAEDTDFGNDEDLYIAITDDAIAKPVVATTSGSVTECSATYTTSLDQPTMTPITYQTDETDSVTGGHTYKQYEPAGVEYESVSLKLTGASNPNGAKFADYLENLTAATRPAVSVVLSFENDYEGETSSASVTEVAGQSISNAGGSTTYNTSSALASRLKSGAVAFRITSDALSTNSTIFDNDVTKIEIDGTSYAFTASGTTTVTRTDGKIYTLTGFTASTANSVKVYYGSEYVVTYTLN
jgi:hypothetical protein